MPNATHPQTVSAGWEDGVRAPVTAPCPVVAIAPAHRCTRRDGRACGPDTCFQAAQLDLLGYVADPRDAA